MIFEILQVITEEINTFFGGNSISLENIANIDTETDGDTSGVILTLLNMQEEFALKNIANTYINRNEVAYKNPKVNLNLYILFCANNATYIESLKSISKVIQFFQGKRVFTQANSTFEHTSEMQNLKNFKFIIDLYTPSFEELNFIWGTLGGKQYPSVLYKISSIEIERNTLIGKGKLITEINKNVKNK
ncbi:MAG: DUF4255 domain-containing protein [Flavobacteriaceae bacterium]|nr:DUF4255 domain-containing protein [Flavobacteriaceae bacterium]